MNRAPSGQSRTNLYSRAVRAGRRHARIVHALRILFAVLLIGGTAIWRHRASADEVAGTNIASPQARTQSGFVQTTTVNPQAASTTTITTAILATRMALVNGIVDIEVYNAANQKVGQQYFVGQNITVNQTMTYTYIWAGSASGTYRVAVGVFGASWTPTYLWVSKAANFTINVSAPTATSTAVPPSSTSTPLPPTATSTNTSVPPTATSTAVPPSSTSTPLPPTATSTNTPVPPTATSTASASNPTFTQSTTASPSTQALAANTASAGASYTISTTVTDMSGGLQNGIIDIEVYALPAYTRVGQQFFSGQNLGAGRSVTQTIAWTSPGPGTYQVAVGVFGTNWTPNYFWALPAATITDGGATATATSTGTAVPPSSTNTPIPATATSTQTATGPTSTSTPVPPTSTPSGPAPTPGPGCQFLSAPAGTKAAFCDTFSVPAGTGNRSGDLNGAVWGTSRLGNAAQGQGILNGWYPTALNLCGSSVQAQPESDIRICNGQVREAVNDGGSVNGGNGNTTVLAMYVTQPFDIAGRTGTAVFDVSDNSQGEHMAWPEWWYTDQPVPAPHAITAAGQDTYPRNGFGFSLASVCQAGQWCNPGCTGTQTSPAVTVDTMILVANYAPSSVSFTHLGCVVESTDPSQLNHFEVRISQSTVQVYGTDAGTSSPLKLIAEADNVNLPLTRGLVWINDVHYNACKTPGTQCINTFGWDNMGFDGPVLPGDVHLDVNDALVPNGQAGQQLNLGWYAPDPSSGNKLTLSIPGATSTALAAASGALLTLNWNPQSSAAAITYRLNGGTWHTVAWPYPDADAFTWRTLAIPVSLSELVAGTNTLDLQISGNGAAVANVDLILAGARSTSAPTP